MTESTDTTRQKLLDAALKVFAQKGHTHATVREICAEAGANVAAVNYHFGGKDALYAEVLKAVFADGAIIAEQLRDLSVPAKERLETYVRGFCMSCYGCEGCDRDTGAAMGAIYLMEMANPSKALEEVVERYIRPEADALHAILSELLGPEASDQLITACGQLIVAQVLSSVTLWPIMSRLYPEATLKHEDLDEFVALITRFSLGGIEAVRKNFIRETESDHE